MGCFVELSVAIVSYFGGFDGGCYIVRVSGLGRVVFGWPLGVL